MQITRRQQRQQDIVGDVPLAILPIASFLLQYVGHDISFFVLLLLLGFAGFVMDVISIFTERWRIAALSLIVGVILWAYLWPAAVTAIERL